MDSLFGVSTQLLAQIIGIATLIAIVVIIGLAATNRIMFRIGSRNVTRTPLQSLLIVIGLMLSTTIIGASLGVGDTVTHSIRKVALDATGFVDQEIENLQGCSISEIFRFICSILIECNSISHYHISRVFFIAKP